jgi:hypothetical protein
MAARRRAPCSRKSTATGPACRKRAGRSSTSTASASEP